MVRPAWTKSVRFQLTFWYVATLAAILLLIATGIVWGLRQAMLRQTDQTLAAEAAQIVRLLANPIEPNDSDEAPEKPDPAAVLAQSTPSVAAMRGILTVPMSIRLSRADTRETVATSQNLNARDPLAETLAALPHPSNAGPTFVFAGSNDEMLVRCLTVQVPKTSYLLQIATPWDGVEDLLTRMTLGIGGAIALFLLLSSVGSWLLVGRAFRPIESIVTEAEHLTVDQAATMSLQSRDISDNEIGHLVAALNRMLARLSSAFAAQRQFTADASHELRTPLTILQGEMELALTRERSSLEYKRTLESGLEETRRLARIVDSLAYLARSDGSEEHSSFRRRSPISLMALATAAYQSLARVVEDKKQSLTIAGISEAFVLGDEEALNRVVRNLLDNAIRYTSPGGRIAISAEQTEIESLFIVSDTGIGIASEDLPFVFDRFYRADKARFNDGGSGLGLSICQNIIAAHGGRVEVESALGVGSRFSVILPRARLANEDGADFPSAD